MKVWWKWSLAAVVLFLAVPLTVQILVKQDGFKQWLSDRVAASNGSSLTIAGNLQLVVFGGPRIRAESIQYSNARWHPIQWTLEASQVEATVNLRNLLFGKLSVEELVLKNAELRVEKNPAVDTRQAPPKPWPSWLELVRVEVVDGKIIAKTERRSWDIRLQHGRITSSGRSKPLAVTVRGEIEQTPVTAEATIGSLETLFDRSPSLLVIAGHIGDTTNRVRATGSAMDLFRWRGVDLWLDFDMAQLPTLEPLVKTRLPAIGKVTGSAWFHQVADFRTMQLLEVTAQSSGSGIYGTNLHGMLTGEMPVLYLFQDIAMDLTIDGAMDLATSPIRAQWLDPLHVKVTASLRGSQQNLRLNIETAEADNTQLALRMSGTMSRIDGVWQNALPVALVVKDVGQLMRLPDKQFTQLGEVNARAELVRMSDAWHLRNLTSLFEHEALQLKVSGKVNQLTTAPLAALHVVATATDGRYLQPFFEKSLPKLAELHLAADLAIQRGGVRATVQKLKGKVGSVALSASGMIDEVQRGRGVALDLIGEVASVYQLSEWAGRVLPRSQPLRLRAKLTDDAEGKFNLTDINAELVDARFELQARGAVYELGQAMRTDMEVEVKLAEWEVVQPLLPLLATSESAAVFIKTLLPVKVSGTLHAEGLRHWGVRNFKAESLTDGGVTLHGEIARIAPLRARLRMVAKHLEAFHIAWPWGTSWPHGQLALSLDLATEQGKLGIDNIVATIDSAAVKVTLHGAIEQLRPLAISTMEMTFESRHLAALGWLRTDFFNSASSISGHGSLTADALGLRSAVHLEIGSSDVHGTWEWRLPSAIRTRPWLLVNLVSEQLNLHEIFASDANNPLFFSRGQLPAHWIRQANGRLELVAKQVSTPHVRMRDIDAQMVLHEGTLQQTITATMGGDLTMNLAMDANHEPLSAEFSLTGKHLATTNLVKLDQDKHQIDGGTFETKIDFSSTGFSIAELAANSNGNVELWLNQTRMKNQTLDILGGDIFSTVITVLNPVKSISEYINIECGLMRFDITQGQATIQDGLAIKTDRVTLFGAGNVDFRDESLRILLLPKARKGFGINSSSLVQVIRIGGSLAQPKIEADTLGFLQSGVSLWATVSSSGLSLLAQGLLNRYRANSDVCSAKNRTTAL